MLIRFSVENHRSFRDRVTLSMIAGDHNLHTDHLIKGAGPGGVDLLRLAVVFGANASGKSNLVHALRTATEMIRRSPRIDEPLVYTPFKLDAESRTKPTRFEFELKVQDKFYSYGFAFHATAIVEEWLFEIGTDPELPLFERDEQGIRLGDFGEVGEAKQFLDFTAKGTPKNRLFSTEYSERGVHKVAMKTTLLNLIFKMTTICLMSYPSNFKLLKVINTKSLEDINRIIVGFDAGIEEVTFGIIAPAKQKSASNQTLSATSIVGEGNDSYIDNGWFFEEKEIEPPMLVSHLTAEKPELLEFHFRHSGHSEPLGYTDESDGTKRLIDIGHIIIDAAQVSARAVLGSTFTAIDEFDRSLHPDLSHALLRMFLEESVGNQNQLLVTTHDATLLGRMMLRPDEVLFVEKQRDQSSRLLSLDEYKGAAEATQSPDLLRDYLNGRFGGVPVLTGVLSEGRGHAQKAL